jgi:transposase-like protein
MKRCSRCGSNRYYKNGTVHGQQRYVCKDCKRSFGGGVHSADVKNKAIYMYINNVGIRKIGRMVGVSFSVVINWIRKASEEIKMLKKVEGKDGMDEIELDEIFTYVKKNLRGCLYGLLIAGERRVLLNMK